VACPQRSTSTDGVNQRRSNSSPRGDDERGLGEVHLARDLLETLFGRPGRKNTNPGGIAGEGLPRKRVDLKDLLRHGRLLPRDDIASREPHEARSKEAAEIPEAHANLGSSL
jgi:hypothetical protein